jgi:hypothetical protein
MVCAQQLMAKLIEDTALRSEGMCPSQPGGSQKNYSK